METEQKMKQYLPEALLGFIFILNQWMFSRGIIADNYHAISMVICDILLTIVIYIFIDGVAKFLRDDALESTYGLLAMISTFIGVVMFSIRFTTTFSSIPRTAQSVC